MFISIFQALTAVLLIILVLIQVKAGGINRTSLTSFSRRGVEKFIFKLTFVTAGLFLLFSALNLFL